MLKSDGRITKKWPTEAAMKAESSSKSRRKSWFGLVGRRRRRDYRVDSDGKENNLSDHSLLSPEFFTPPSSLVASEDLKISTKGSSPYNLRTRAKKDDSISSLQNNKRRKSSCDLGVPEKDIVSFAVPRRRSLGIVVTPKTDILHEQNLEKIEETATVLSDLTPNARNSTRNSSKIPSVLASPETVFLSPEFLNTSTSHTSVLSLSPSKVSIASACTDCSRNTTRSMGKRIRSFVSLSGSIKRVGSRLSYHPDPSSSFTSESCTPSRNSTLMKTPSSSKVTRAANAILKGLSSSSKTNLSVPRPRMDSRKQKKERRNSDCHAEELARRRAVIHERNLKKREQLHEFERVMNVTSESLRPIFTSEKLLYDAVVCEVYPDGRPASEISKLILEAVGEDVIYDVSSELNMLHEVFITEGGLLFSCRYVVFVVRHKTPSELEKTWREMRIAYCTLLEKIIDRSQISSLLLPYLFTGEPPLDQSTVAQTALASIQIVFLQRGFSKLTRITIGGLEECDPLYDIYSVRLNDLLNSMKPEEISDTEFESAIEEDFGKNCDERMVEGSLNTPLHQPDISGTPRYSKTGALHFSDFPPIDEV
ncbi:hypothetical protein AB6A40_008194 [Gnathostoma spinigerum]|uniref:Uncharacterized protein n=1 Tax=Gnathostoma spinigerum TaxID=75299 RepID=A0ABD6END5_9BILA